MANKVRHHPGCPAKEIKDTNEKAFQRAIYYGENTFLEGHDRIRWIDFELSVENNPQARDCCVDLIGEDSNGRYVLCELKFSGKSGLGNGSPQEAGEQLNRYYKLLLDNVEFVTFHKNVRDTVFDVERFCKTKPRLLVAADECHRRLRLHRSCPTENPTVRTYAVHAPKRPLPTGLECCVVGHR